MTRFFSCFYLIFYSWPRRVELQIRETADRTEGRATRTTTARYRCLVLTDWRTERSSILKVWGWGRLPVVWCSQSAVWSCGFGARRTGVGVCGLGRGHRGEGWRNIMTGVEKQHSLYNCWYSTSSMYVSYTYANKLGLMETLVASWCGWLAIFKLA